TAWAAGAATEAASEPRHADRACPGALLPARDVARAAPPPHRPPDLVRPRRCKYHPTCSAYAMQAVERYGILRGAVLAAWRLLRCNPFSHGGYDPVTAQRLVHSAPRARGRANALSDLCPSSPQTRSSR